MYLLAQLIKGVACCFTLPLYCLLYALPSYAGQLSKGDKDRLDSLFRKAYRRGFCFQTFSIEELISAADKKLFRQITSNIGIAYIHSSQAKANQSTKFSQKPWTQLSVTTNSIRSL